MKTFKNLTCAFSPMAPQTYTGQFFRTPTRCMLPLVDSALSLSMFTNWMALGTSSWLTL